MTDKLTERERKVARELGGGASYESLRRTGVAQDGDFDRLVDKGAVSPRSSGRHELTERGEREVYK